MNSLVIVEKSNGQMRLCIDPKDLNKVVKREHFQIPTKEEILGKLGDAKWFSKLEQQPVSTRSSWINRRPC